MANFEVNYSNYAGYDEKITVEVRLMLQPSKEDYQNIIDAITILDTVAAKYVDKQKTNNVKESK